MKKTYPIVMLALLLTTFIACKKDKGNSPDLKKDLVSTWELAEVSSSWIPKQTYAPGNGNILRVNNDGSYFYYAAGQIKEQGNYTIVADTTVEKEVCLVNLKDKYKNRLETTNVTPIPTVAAFKTFFYIENDRLYMIAGCYAVDGGSLRVYRRANPMPLD